MRWPSYFPEGCPPEAAVPANGVVYRLVTNNPPTIRDFQPLRIKQPHRNFKECECQACGLSVQREVGDARELMRRIPAFKERQVAQGNLNPKFGMIMPTPTRKSRGTSHHTWWLPEKIDPSSLFSVLKGGVV